MYNTFHQKSFPDKDIPLVFLPFLIFVQILLQVVAKRCTIMVQIDSGNQQIYLMSKPELFFWLIYITAKLSANVGKSQELI